MILFSNTATTVCFLLSDLCFYITKCLYFQIIRLCRTES
nr:MAG TPA: hypothetical protein [Caudoviricetes sp.]DAR63001.1 MAG TPA: hypothetical protein [Caudoviricetes sp.]